MAGLLGWKAVLNLPNVVITGRDEDEESYLIHAESEATVRLCPSCGSFNSVVIGSRNQPFVDTQMHAKTVRIDFNIIQIHTTRVNLIRALI